MKKIIVFTCSFLFLASFSFAASDRSNVYISANLSQSFENFSYDSFVGGFSTDTDNSKILSGPRYDFSVGYIFGTKVRAEAQYMIISENSFKSAQAESKVEYHASAVFANLIYDFWDAQNSFITPFIGAGIGIGSPNLKLSVSGLQEEKDKNGFSWQLQGGVNVKLISWLLVNVKYTYLSMPGVENSISNGTADLESEFKKGVQAVGVGVTLLL